jgi:hypothetical protein
MSEDSNSDSSNKKSFFNHVFSTTEEGKAEILNVAQYSFMGIIPIVILNKLIQRFIPEADPEKSTLELLAEILIQIVVMFGGIILIHRVITFVPTYSEFKYESLTLTNIILAFLVLVLSIQTKLGLKVNILFDRVMDLWNGTDSSSEKSNKNNKKNVRSIAASRHVPSQGDSLDSFQGDMFPPAPLATTPVRQQQPMMQTMGQTPTPTASGSLFDNFGPVAANAALGSAFGALF